MSVGWCMLWFVMYALYVGWYLYCWVMDANVVTNKSNMTCCGCVDV